MLRIVHANTRYTVDQIDLLRQHVIAKLAEGNELVVLPLGYTIELIPAPPAYTDVASATSAIVAAAVSRYEATMKAWGHDVESSIDPNPSRVRLTRRCWPARLWLSYKSWRRDMGVLDWLRAAWRIWR